MKKTKLRKTVFSAMLAAIYCTTTLCLAPISFGVIQFRPAEALCVLPFLFPEAVQGLFIGCLIANIMSPYGVLDMVVGSAATLLAALCTMLMRRENAGIGRKALACLPPVLTNALMISCVTAFSSGTGDSIIPIFLTNALQIGISEAAVVYIIGLPLLIKLPGTSLYKHIKSKLDGQ